MKPSWNAFVHIVWLRLNVCHNLILWTKLQHVHVYFQVFRCDTFFQFVDFDGFVHSVKISNSRQLFIQLWMYARMQIKLYVWLRSNCIFPFIKKHAKCIRVYFCKNQPKNLPMNGTTKSMHLKSIFKQNSAEDPYLTFQNALSHFNDSKGIH